MAEFFYDNFWGPIVEQGVAGYNLINTPVYAVLFAIAVFVSYKLLKKLKIDIDRRFFIGIFPFIVLGSVLRVVRDSNIFPTPFLVSPLIYFSLFIIAVVSLLAAVGLDRFVLSKGKAGNKIAKDETNAGTKVESRGGFVPANYYKIWAAIGWVLVVYGLFLLSPLGIKNVFALEAIVGISFVWAALIFILYKTQRFKLLTKENAGIIWAHLFDATTTFTALQFFADAGYYEQHVVSNVVIGVLGPAGQFVLKLAVVPIVLWALDKELPRPENRFLRNFLKIAILIVGFAPGLRNGLRLVLGV